MTDTQTLTLWQGPSGLGPNGGVSQSMISAYLACPERFRIANVLGWSAPEKFNHAIEYGNFFHLALEQGSSVNGLGDYAPQAVKDYACNLCLKYPFQQEEIQHWYNVFLIHWPIYQQFYGGKSEPEEVIQNEQIFDVSYVLPSKREVRLRGKWDKLSIKEGGLYCTDHKTKGEIDRESIERQLLFDLQTMTYLVALLQDTGLSAVEGIKEKHKVTGISYNVVRRPLQSGQSGSIRQKKDESPTAFYLRLGEVIRADAANYFQRWNVQVAADDTDAFRLQCLDPILDNLADDFEWWHSCLKHDENIYDYQERAEWFPEHLHRHFRMPYGLWPLSNREHPLDNYLATGSVVGLEKATSLFRELQ